MASPISVWYSDGPFGPRTDPRAAVRAAGLDGDAAIEVTLGLTVEPAPWLRDPSLTIRTVLAGYALGALVDEGRVTSLPMRMSAVPALARANPPDVAVIGGIRRGDSLAFHRGVAWADTLAALAPRIVVEVASGETDLGAPEIEGRVVALLDRPDGPGGRPSRPADEIDLAIGAHVAALLPEEPTLQFGPGGIGEGIARSIDRPVRIESGLITDAIAMLHERGLLIDRAVGTHTWGSEPIDRLATSGALSLVSCTVTHDIGRLARIPRFVACNTAVQVGLDGAVNVERVGGRTVAAVGGHADFCLGATLSDGGLSIVALRSQARNAASTIVPTVDPVSTPRSDVQFVVTEHGVADLRGADDAERARRIIDVAAPAHREALSAARPRSATRAS
jgi:hypothetical protein